MPKFSTNRKAQNEVVTRLTELEIVILKLFGWKLFRPISHVYTRIDLNCRLTLKYIMYPYHYAYFLQCDFWMFFGNKTSHKRSQKIIDFLGKFKKA